ncbi:hypothetical protein A2U01_0058331, partial [Trifolium medium]|nr:hypothetical protein [Trifolium medium]
MNGRHRSSVKTQKTINYGGTERQQPPRRSEISLYKQWILTKKCVKTTVYGRERVPATTYNPQPPRPTLQPPYQDIRK